MATHTVVTPATGAATRLISLDVFRGLTMAAMVIVNNPGDWDNVYPPLLHAQWHGWTPTDLIFPFFLFIAGVSITLSRKVERPSRILRRAAIIFGLGLFLAGYPLFDLERWRIPGVLQRIAVCYLIAAAAYYIVRKDPRSAARPLRAAGILATLAAVLALGYWAVLMLVPPPGGVAGDLSPEGNLGAHLDRALMGGHLWKPRWDPEGLLSTVPAIATTLLGCVAGLWIQAAETPHRRAAVLAIAGIVGIIVGTAWGFVFPINKSLWTSSYVCFTAGAAALILALFDWAIDIKGWRRWTGPLVVLGVNALALYVISGFLVETLATITVPGAGEGTSLSRYIYLHYFAPFAAPKNASLAYAMAHLAILYVLLAWMYRSRIFLRA
ncbi:MAG: heparan-alpha-glucosaminide N-acetyltransferase domain-containing protein [Acidobacteria bacterium]|nr:heparan-alpha-glucosaminide N-acetyltransferase domain-containing protein [Acidobacteriota bacterium]MCA1649334.1 heparan-alpha-glucosaminide N-acetyltransferase domain-containing protein [Acidobacteriota bacterium]